MICTVGENMTGVDKEALEDGDQESSSDDSQGDFHAKLVDVKKELDQKNQLALSHQLNQNGGALINLDEDSEEEKENEQLRDLIEKHLQRVKDKKELRKQHKKKNEAIQKGLEKEYGANIVICDSDCSHCATENHQHEEEKSENGSIKLIEEEKEEMGQSPPNSKVSSKQRKVSKADSTATF